MGNCYRGMNAHVVAVAVAKEKVPVTAVLRSASTAVDGTAAAARANALRRRVPSIPALFSWASMSISATACMYKRLVANRGLQHLVDCVLLGGARSKMKADKILVSMADVVQFMQVAFSVVCAAVCCEGSWQMW